MHNFSSGCEVADMLVQRLEFGPERPRGAALHVRAVERQRLPRARRRRGDSAADADRARQPRHGGHRPAVLAGEGARGRARAPRPHLRPGARRPVRRARRATGSSGSASAIPGTRCSRSSPSRIGCSRARRSTRRSSVAADFIDLKSPYMGGHSRRCAQLAADAARLLGLSDEDASRGSAGPRSCTTSARPRVPNSIWDKPGALTRAEFDRVELHPMLTEQMLRRSPALAALNPVACGAPREVRRLGLPQARPRRRRRSAARACWPRRRSTSG